MGKGQLCYLYLYGAACIRKRCNLCATEYGYALFLGIMQQRLHHFSGIYLTFKVANYHSSGKMWRKTKLLPQLLRRYRVGIAPQYRIQQFI